MQPGRTNEGTHNDSRLSRVERNFDRDDKLRNHGQDFAAAVLEHVKRSLDCKETVWLLLFAQAIKKDGEVVVVIQLFDVNLPLDPAPLSDGSHYMQEPRHSMPASKWRALVQYCVPVAHTTVLNSNRQIATLVEAPEFRVGRVLSDLESTRHGLFDRTDLLLANRQRGARATGRVLVGRVSRALVILRARNLGRVAKLGNGIIVVRVVLRIRLLGKRRASTAKPAPSTNA